MLAIAVGMIANFCWFGKLPDIDGEDAVRIAREFARNAGVRSKLELTNLSQIDGFRWGFGSGTFQSVNFIFPDRRTLRVYVAADGKVQLFQTIQANRGESLQSRDNVPAGVDVAKMAAKILKAAHPTGSYKLRPFGAGLWGPFRTAFYDVTVAGHPFFNLNPTYAYNITFDTRTGETNWYSRPPATPQVNATSPHITAVEAKAILEHWGKTHYRSGGGAAAMYAPTAQWNPSLVVELGYFKFKNEDRARLVWRAHVWTHFMNSPSSEGGVLKDFVDAMTGKMLAPDDPGIN